MPQYILKVLANRAHQETTDLNLGHLSANGTTQRRAVKAQPGATYRLVDAKTGEVVKDQSLLRKGRTLQVVVENQVLVEIDGFFPIQVDANAPTTEPAQYIISQGTEASPTYGLIQSNTPVAYSADGMNVVWTPNLPMANTVDAKAIGLTSLAALSGGGAGSWGAGAGAALLAVTMNGSKGGGSDGGGGGSPVPAKISGKIFAGPVVSNGKGDLTVKAYDSTGKEIREMKSPAVP